VDAGTGSRSKDMTQVMGRRKGVSLDQRRRINSVAKGGLTFILIKMN
jgi:hypothetical protein